MYFRGGGIITIEGEFVDKSFQGMMMTPKGFPVDLCPQELQYAGIAPGHEDRRFSEPRGHPPSRPYDSPC